MKKQFVIILLVAFYLNACSKTDEPVYKLQDAPVNSKVEDLLARMTLKEKIAQMRMFHAQLGVKLNESDELMLSETVTEKLKLGVGGIKNPGEHYSPVKSAILNNLLQKHIIENSRLGIPAFFVTESYNGVDAEGCTSFGHPINMAATFNRELVKRVYDAAGREARLRGLHLTHSPEVDIVRDPRFGRMSEAFSEDT